MHRALGQPHLWQIRRGSLLLLLLPRESKVNSQFWTGLGVWQLLVSLVFECIKQTFIIGYLFYYKVLWCNLSNMVEIFNPSFYSCPCLPAMGVTYILASLGEGEETKHLHNRINMLIGVPCFGIKISKFDLYFGETACYCTSDNMTFPNCTRMRLLYKQYAPLLSALC